MATQEGIYLRGNTWWIDVYRDGKRIRRSAKTTDRKQAQELYDRIANDLWREEELGAQAKVTLAEVMLAWFEANSTHKSLYDYQLRMGWIRKEFGDATPLVDIDPDELVKRKLKDKWKGKTVSLSTINRYLSALSVLFTLAKAKKWITHRPHFPYTTEDNQREGMLYRDDSIRLISELPMHLALIFSLGVLTGLRENNLIELTWKHIDFDNKCIRYKKSEVKNKTVLIIPISDDAVEVLKMCQGDHKEWVFTYRGKRTHKVSNSAWYKARKRAGLGHMTFHEATRHTWASWQAMSGTPLSVLKELGGWKDSRMVERYAHFAPEHLKQYAGNGKMK